MTRLVTIELEEYNELLAIKECHEKNLERLEGMVTIAFEDFEKYKKQDMRIATALSQIQETFEYGDEWHWDSGGIRVCVEKIEDTLKGKTND